MRTKLLLAAAATFFTLTASAAPQGTVSERVDVVGAQPKQARMAPFMFDRVQGEYQLDDGRVLTVTGKRDGQARKLYADLGDGAQVTVAERPEVVQCFVDGSIIGWYNYLYNDNSAANALIKQANPEQTDERIDYAIRVLNQRGIVMSGDALAGGIGAMADARWQAFYESMVAVGVLPPGLDVARTHTLEFVNKGIGKP